MFKMYKFNLDTKLKIHPPSSTTHLLLYHDNHQMLPYNTSHATTHSTFQFTIFKYFKKDT